MTSKKVRFYFAGALVMLVFAGVFLYFLSEDQFKKELLSPAIKQEVQSNAVELNDFYRLHYSTGLARYISKKYFGVDFEKGFDKTGNLVKGSFDSEIDSYASLYVSVSLGGGYGSGSPGEHFLSYLSDHKRKLLEYNSDEVFEEALSKESEYYDTFYQLLPMVYFFDVADDSTVTLMIDELRLPLPISLKEMDFMLDNLKMDKSL